MKTIRVIFDGKTFVPRHPITLPEMAEALVLVEGDDQIAQKQLDDEVRAYYQNGADAEDESWGRAIETDSKSAWDED